MYIYDPQNIESLNHLRSAEALRREVLAGMWLSFARAVKSLF